MKEMEEFKRPKFVGMENVLVKIERFEELLKKEQMYEAAKTYVNNQPYVLQDVLKTILSVPTIKSEDDDF